MWFLTGLVVGGIAVHWRWRRWNRKRKVEFDGSKDNYIESQTKAGNRQKRSV